jgi:hypothetical protein
LPRLAIFVIIIVAFAVFALAAVAVAVAAAAAVAVGIVVVAMRMSRSSFSRRCLSYIDDAEMNVSVVVIVEVVDELAAAWPWSILCALDQACWP